MNRESRFKLKQFGLIQLPDEDHKPPVSLESPRKQLSSIVIEMISFVASKLEINS